MNELKVFGNNEFGRVRTQVIDGEPYLMLNDVCRVLEIKNPRDVKNRLNKKGVVITDTLTSGGIQQTTFINESNLYKVIFQSRKPQAEKFTDWVTSEVLPSLRKNGYYRIEKYKPKATSVGEVVNLINMTRKSMKEQGCEPREIAKAVKQICEQFNINLPNCFVKPKETTMTDVYDMIDFIYAHPRGKGKKIPTYEDYIIYASVKRLE